MTEDNFENCLSNIRFLAAATDINTVFQKENKKEKKKEGEGEEAAIVTGLTGVEMNLALDGAGQVKTIRGHQEGFPEEGWTIR